MALRTDTDEMAYSCATASLGNEKQKQKQKQETELTVHRNKSLKLETLRTNP